MTSIVVNDELAKAIAQSPGMVEVRNRAGTILGYITHGFTADDISIAKQRLQSDEPFAVARCPPTPSQDQIAHRRTSATFSRPAARSHVWVSTMTFALAEFELYRRFKRELRAQPERARRQEDRTTVQDVALLKRIARHDAVPRIAVHWLIGYFAHGSSAGNGLSGPSIVRRTGTRRPG